MVGGHIEVKNATPVMCQHQKHVKYLETDGGHSEEVDEDQLLGVVLQECAPSHGGLRQGTMYLLTLLSPMSIEFEHLTVNAGCTPTGILSAHLADQISDLPGKDRASRLATPQLPSPEPPTAVAWCGNDAGSG